MGPLHDPAPRRLAGLAFAGDFLAAGAQVKREAEGLGEVAGLLVVVALVEAQVLGFVSG